MKKILIVYGLFLFGCKQSTPQNEAEVPDALQDQSSFSLKRRSDDLVDQLYKEVVDKTPELKQLEDEIEKLANDKSDSLNAFTSYDGKNQGYYNAAKRHLEQLEDSSALTEKIIAQVSASLAAYNARTDVHQKLMTSINESTESLNDLHEMLKIVKTLPVIASYQQKNLPSAKPLSTINNRYAIIVKQFDTLVKK